MSKLIFANKSFCFKYSYDMFNVESSSDASCNRTDQSYLNPYKPGSQLKPRRISNQLAYNQDHSNST